MTDDRRPRDGPDKILESGELDGTQDSEDSIVSPAEVQAAKSDAKTTVDLSDLDAVFNIDDLELMVYGSGSNPGSTKQESSLEDIDAMAESIATFAGNHGMGTEFAAEDEAKTVETTVKPVDHQQDVSASKGSGEKAKTAAIGLDDTPSTKKNAAARARGKLPLFSLLLGLLGIAAGLGAVYFAYLLQSKLAVIDQRVEAIVQAPSTAEVTPAEVARLHSRVEEVATLIEESSHMQDYSGEEIDSLKSRISKMEQEIGGLRDNAADRNLTTAAKIPSPASAPRIPMLPATSKGSWVVNVESLTTEKAAAAAVIRLRSKGINAETYAHIKDGTTWYRVRVPGFSTPAEARAYAKNVLSKAEFSQAWIGPMQ